MSSADQRIALADETDLAGFRAAARRLMAQAVAPERVSFQVASAAAAELFEPTAAHGSEATTGPSVLRVPPFYAQLCEHVLLHRDPARFGLMYRLLWRLLHEPGLRNDPLDADRLRAEELARAVRRDLHKMTAFVRFRPLAAGDSTGDDPLGPLHVAWFEPQHHIVEAVAPFFARRFAQMRWAILTPERCVRWDGERLAFSAGAQRDEAPPADAGEALWLTYYESIFNPARLKLAMMQKEMPRRYWHNLPEAVLIQPLAAAATQRSARMVEQGPSTPARRRPVASLSLTPTPTPTPTPSSTSTSAAADTGAMDDRPAASLQVLAQGEERCRDCPIGAQATQAVPGEGPLGARLMLVGEQPGDQEDLRGRPFVGPAGALLDRALAQLGWPREQLYVTNAVKHFKFELRGKRRIHKTPAQREAAACLQWLEREIELVAPGALVALGATAARALLGRDIGVMRERGRWLVRDDGRRVLVTLHPSALLRLPDTERAAAWDAWLTDLTLASEAVAGDREEPD